MDTIWYINPSKSEVIGRFGGDEKNPNDHAEPTKVERYINKNKNQCNNTAGKFKDDRGSFTGFLQAMRIL